MIEGEPMTPNEYATMALGLITMAMLAIGGIAMVVREVNRWRMRTHVDMGDVARQFVADVKKGDGFTFHQSLTTKETPEVMSSGDEEHDKKTVVWPGFETGSSLDLPDTDAVRAGTEPRTGTEVVRDVYEPPRISTKLS